ncbi:SUKH-4 family immunity protein [Streptomyces sp. NPDC001848]|uniref:SUKH-4 family immunity protein n=1 Tax=Streptomyces sp. NPDC001848 TaxID=3364618 RepID=UPI0036BEDACA
MGRTDTGGVITFDEADLDLCTTHGQPRRPLTGTEPTSDTAVLWLRVLGGRPALRRVAELVDEAERLAEALRDQLVIGALRTVDRDLQSLLDGATTYAFPRTRCLMDPPPLAPSLEQVLRFAATTHELTDDLAPAWRMAALIRPLTRTARPGTGLALDLPPRLLDEEFGTAAVVRFEDVDFPATLTHEPTRRFLREVGLPENGHWYELDTDVPLPTLTEYYAHEEDFPEDDLPEGAARLIRLGHLPDDTSLLLDGADGALLCWSAQDPTLRPLNADISTLAFTVWLAHRERRKRRSADHLPAVGRDAGGEAVAGIEPA